MTKTLMMTASQVGSSYRQAADKDEQLYILAQLNDISIKEVVDILVDSGYDVNMKEEHLLYDQIMELWKKQLTDQKIGEAIGKSGNFVAKWRYNRGVESWYKVNIKRKPKPSKNSGRMSMRGNYKELHDEGMTPVEIAEALGVTKFTVYRWMKEDGLIPNGGRIRQGMRKRELKKRRANRGQ